MSNAPYAIFWLMLVVWAVFGITLTTQWALYRLRNRAERRRPQVIITEPGLYRGLTFRGVKVLVQAPDVRFVDCHWLPRPR